MKKSTILAGFPLIWAIAGTLFLSLSSCWCGRDGLPFPPKAAETNPDQAPQP